MECFTHANTNAVGVCKNCGKAICRECAHDAGFAVTCSDACATEAAALNEMNQRGKKLYGIDATSSRLASSVVMWAIFFVCSIGYGLWQLPRNHDLAVYVLGFGGICGFMCLFSYRRSKSIGLQV
jgi:hypothetical protein